MTTTPSITNSLAVTVCDESDRCKPMFTFTCDRLSVRSDANGGGFVLIVQCDERVRVYPSATQQSREGLDRAIENVDSLERTLVWVTENPSEGGEQILPFSADWSIQSVARNVL